MLVFRENLECITRRNINSLVVLEPKLFHDSLIFYKDRLHLAHGVLRLLIVFLFEVFHIDFLLIYLVEIR